MDNDSMNNEPFILKLKNIVGPENLITDENEMLKRSKDTTPWKRQPIAFVLPKCTEETQAIVKLANEFKIPLWVVSGGRNWGYGAATAVRPQSLIVDLSRMNQILELNEEMAYAVVEPGVTYQQFNDYIKQSKKKLWIDCIDGTPNGSVTGNALERGMGVTDYCDHFGNVCGMEVVLPSGEIMHTGGGQIGNCKTFNVHKWGTGPYLEGLFTQGNFGIVTKMGIWLMPAPEECNIFSLELSDDKNLLKMVDDLRGLALRRIISGGCHFINDIVLFAVLSQYPKDILSTKKNLSDSLRAKMRENLGVGCWTIGGSITGTAAQVKANRSVVKKTLARYGRLEFFDSKKVALINKVVSLLRKAEAKPYLAKWIDKFARLISGGKPLNSIDALSHAYSVAQGNPTEYFVRHAYFRCSSPKPDTDINPARDDCGLIWFAPIAPMNGKNVTEIIALCEPLFRKYGFDFYVACLLQNPRAVIVLMSIMYIKDDPEQTSRANQLFNDLTKLMEQAGYQQYRTGVGCMDHVLDGAPTFRAFVNNLKSAIDPNGVIMPGKYGIG